MADLLELAERCEQVSVSDRELDKAIWLATTPGATRKSFDVPANETRRGWTIDETRDATHRLIVVPAYTASLDAAMTLVPEGAVWGVGNSDDPHPSIWKAGVMPLKGPAGDCIKGKSPALALTAACLRARAAITPSTPLTAQHERTGQQ